MNNKQVFDTDVAKADVAKADLLERYGLKGEVN